MYGSFGGGVVRLVRLALWQSSIQVMAEGKATYAGRLNLNVTVSTNRGGPADSLLAPPVPTAMQSRFATRPGNRFACWTLALWLLVVGMLAGCRAASSLGLPLALGTHGLLKEASQARAAGHIDLETSTELAKTALPAHRSEAGDVRVWNTTLTKLMRRC